MTQLDFTNATFDSSIGLPSEILATLNILPVDFYLLEDAKYCAGSPMGDRIQEHLNQLFQGSQEDWIQVGNLMTDDSHYDEFEDKWEYGCANYVLYVRKEELNQARKDYYQRQGQGLRYSPFSGLGGVSMR